MIRRLALVAMTVGLVASCGVSHDAACEPAAAAYREAITRGAPVEDDILTTASAVPGAWFIVARVDDSTAVWVTDRDPRGEELGQIITANRAAHRLSSADLVGMPWSMSALAQAAGDPDQIAVAEACIGA